jgi:two-component system phosphate regulon sensor histidine kinase PhoR
MIREENQRMLSQVENILMISRLEKSSSPIDLSEIDIHHALEDALRRVDLIVKNQKGKIDTQLHANHTLFKGNLNHFTNLIVNLLDNAIKYSDGAPVITISTSNEDKMIILNIRDEGIGMDVNTQKHIFEKFFREQSGNIHNVKGHGLGLSYVKKVIELHGGDIKLISKIRKGTTFVISVPLL